MESTWFEYLKLINNMAKMPGMYSLDQMRVDLHKKLTKYYSEFWDEFIPERFDEICHNLDKVIDFNPPLEKYDNIKPYASEISTRMLIGDLKHYVLGRRSKLPNLKI